MKHLIYAACLLGAATLTPAAFAQSNVQSNHKYAWSENIGFTNWRDAGSPLASRGAHLYRSFFSGFVWCENVGYLNLGDGTPAAFNGAGYGNLSGADFGVNFNPISGQLSGYAWGENVGWVNFTSGASATPSRPARFDASAQRLRGYICGENIGWVNLDDATIYVGINHCLCDWNDDDALNSQDFFDFLTAFFGGAGDYNANGTTNSQDFFDFLNCFFAGC